MPIQGFLFVLLFLNTPALSQNTTPTSLKTYFQIRLVNEKPTKDTPRLISLVKNKPFALHSEVLLDLSDIESASYIPSTRLPQTIINLILTSKGKKKLLTLSQTHLKKRIGIIINNQLIATPTIIGEIRNGKFSIPIKQPKEVVDPILHGIQNALKQ